MDHYDSFRNRRVEINGTYTGKALAVERLKGMRELLLMELPDRWSDVYGANLGDDIDTPPNGLLNPVALTQRPAMSQVYRRR